MIGDHAERWTRTVATVLRDSLTAREVTVALASARGLTTREIALFLHISPKTVEHHLSRIYRALGVRSRAQLAGTIITELATRIHTAQLVADLV
jgi:DNA-binding NarL/FixJ family response regulator